MATTSPEGTTRHPAERVRAQIEAVLGAWGLRPEHVRVCAEVMTDTDLAGIDSHGLSMLIQYETMRTSGQLNLAAEPRVTRQSASTALVDADAGLGHPAGVMAMELAIEKARAHDLGWVQVHNSHHFGAAGNYALMAARAGLIGLVSCSTRVISVVPARGTKAVLGTNPFALACPAGRHPPILLDMSTSVVAVNKVKVYALNERPLPPGWVVDATGATLTDSGVAYRNLTGAPASGEKPGGLTAIGGAGTGLGGHKGYGLGIFAQILGGTLGGGSFSPIRNLTQAAGDPDNIGQCFMALNPAAFRDPAEFERDVEAMVDVLRATPPARADEPVLIPGDPERASRAERLEHGIPVPPALREAIRGIAAAAEAPFLLA